MERLKELRTAQKLTQQQMADYLGVDRTTYVKYETDKSEPTFDTLQKLADYFGVTVDFLMGRDTIEKPAATTALSPIRTPGRMVACAPTQTLLPRVTRAGVISLRRSGSNAWFSVAMTTC